MPVPFEETPFTFRKIDSDTQTDFIPVPLVVDQEVIEDKEEKVSKFNNKKIITEEL